MSAGFHPRVDENGDPWPAGSTRAALAGQPIFPRDNYFGVMWGMTGDLDYFMKDLVSHIIVRIRSAGVQLQSIRQAVERLQAQFSLESDGAQPSRGQIDAFRFAAFHSARDERLDADV